MRIWMLWLGATVASLACAAPASASTACVAPTVRANYATVEKIVVSCAEPVRAVRIGLPPSHGTASQASAAGSSATASYRPDEEFVGDDDVVLKVRVREGYVSVPITIHVAPFKLRALGDSVTAGFGYYGDGHAWSFSDLKECQPMHSLNDRCSSNSSLKNGSKSERAFADDYGLSESVAWPAQVAGDHGRFAGTDMYKNVAVSGASPADWDEGGKLHDLLEQIIAERPDLTLLTLGANPLVSSVLTGDGLKCRFTASATTLRECLAELLAEAATVSHLSNVLRELLASPHNTIVLSMYHLATPAASIFSVNQLRIMMGELNTAVEAAARTVKESLPPDQQGRILLMQPPRFDIGLPTGHYECHGWNLLASDVDGPSHQATITQVEEQILHPIDFCTGEPWLLSSDLGIHPNRTGHAQYARAFKQLDLEQHLIPVLP